MPEDDDRRQTRPRPFWSGTIAFGLVSLPVTLFVANRRRRVSLRMVDESGTPLGRRYFCSKDERPLERDEIVRGYEVRDDEFVLIEDEELDALAPEKSQEIDLRRFVALSEIDPTYFERAYFLAPEKKSTKAYRLLARSMEETERAGIATFVMRGKEYLVAILAEQGILRAETLRFHDELRSPSDIGLPDLAGADAAQARGMLKDIQAPAADRLDRDELSDLHSRRIRERVDSKFKAGRDVVRLPEADAESEEEAEEGAEVVDLMQYLKRSLQQEESDAAEPREDSGTAGRDGAIGRSKAELYERARELEIPGRSKMTREQLMEAIERVHGRAGRR